MAVNCVLAGSQKLGVGRPASLTTVTGKMLGVNMKETRAEYLENHKKIKQSQYSFIEERSYFLKLFNKNITTRVDKGN